MEKASRRAVEYTTQYENPVLVMEDLAYIREPLDYGTYMNRRLHSWAFAKLQQRIHDKATEAGIPVRYVNPAYTSQICHACRRIGRRDSQAEFRCLHEDCHVSTSQGHQRCCEHRTTGQPWGESIPLDKAGRDDSLRDGSGRDTVMTPRGQSSPQQMTLTVYEESEPSPGNG